MTEKKGSTTAQRTLAEERQAIRRVAIERLAERGLDWGILERPLWRTFCDGDGAHAKRLRPSGRGAPPKLMARMAHVLDRYDLIGAWGGPKGRRCSKLELGLFELLLEGIDKLTAVELRDGSALFFIEHAVANAEQRLQSHGQRPLEFLVTDGTERDGDRVGEWNGKPFRMRKLRRGDRLYNSRGHR